MTGRSEAEREARRSINDSGCIPFGGVSLRRDRDETRHYLVRFPYQLVESEGLEEGARLEQYYDPDSNELRIPLDG